MNLIREAGVWRLKDEIDQFAGWQDQLVEAGQGIIEVATVVLNVITTGDEGVVQIVNLAGDIVAVINDVGSRDLIPFEAEIRRRVQEQIGLKSFRLIWPSSLSGAGCEAVNLPLLPHSRRCQVL